MKFGKERIYTIPHPAINTIGTLADRLQTEAQASGKILAPKVRMHVGEPDFSTPAHIRQAAIESLSNERQTYGPAAGQPWLRELLAAKVQRVDGYTVAPENISIATGGTSAILASILATVNPGEEILYPDPGWPYYAIQLKISGATGVPYPLDPKNDWLPDLEQLEKLVTPQTRMLIINSPANPTGAVFPRQLVADLLDFARRHDLYLLSDECYDQILFEGEHVSPATMISREELESGRFIGIYTFSKTYSMTGWRIGYVVTGKSLLKTIIHVLNMSFTNLNNAVQRAAATALTGPQDCVQEMNEAYRRRRDLVVNLLKDAGRYLYMPHGAFYALIDIRDKEGHDRDVQQFALDLVSEYNTTVTPGTDFGSVAKNFVRISLATADDQLALGVRAICDFADQYKY